MGVDRKKGYFSISAVAKMFSVHQQTIRLYEKEGLLAPKRSTGNTRMFSEEDVNKLEQIIYLTHQLGVNLAGVEQVLKLQKQIQKLQGEMNKLFEKTQQNLGQELELNQKSLKSNTIALMRLKQSDATTAADADATKPPSQTVDIDNWEVEYEE